MESTGPYNGNIDATGQKILMVKRKKIILETLKLENRKKTQEISENVQKFQGLS